MKDKFTFNRAFLEIANSITDENLRIKYLEAVIEYGLDGVEPTDTVLLSLLIPAKLEINKQEKISKTRSTCMKGNKNSTKDWSKADNHSKTEKSVKTEKTETVTKNSEIGNELIKDCSNAEKHVKTETITKNRKNSENRKISNAISTDKNCEIIAKEKTDGIYNISNIYNTSINNTLYNIIKYYTTNKSIYPQIKYLIDKKGFDAYVDEQYKEGVILEKKIGLENLKTILKFCLTDEFRKNQILSIRKLNEKNKDKVPYYLVISEKLLLNKDAQTNNVCSIPTV